MSETEEFKEILEICGEAALKYGIKSLKFEGIDVTFGDHRPQIVFPTPSPMPMGEMNGMPTEDQFLFMSSGVPMTDDELRASPPG